MSDLEIWKAIWEIRYPASALLFDKRGEIATKWQWKSDLTEWRISNNQVTVHNKSNSSFLRAGHVAIVVVVEQPTSYKDFCEQAANFSIDTLELLKIHKIDRIGLRLLQLAERKSFKTLVAKMRKDLYKLNDDDWGVLGGYPEDIAFHLTLNFGDTRANFKLGPMEQEQLSMHFESDNIKSKLPSASLFLDFDLFRVEPKLYPKSYRKDLREFLQSGGEKVLQMSADFVDRYGGFE
jgi:hypothetical protein